MNRHEKRLAGDRSAEAEVTSLVTGRVASHRVKAVPCAPRHGEDPKMHRLMGAASVLALLSGCGGAVDSTSSDTASNALSSTESSSSTSAPDAANVEACLTDYANCVRAGSADDSCHEGLRGCLPRPPPPPGARGDGAGDGDCDRPPPPNGAPDGDAPPPPPPPPRDGDGSGEGGPRPPEGDADRPPPPPPPCIGDLDACARGTEAIETCVDAAVGCFGELPPPPPPGAPPPPPR